MRVIRLARGRWEVLLLADEQGRCQVLEELAGVLVEQGGRGMLALLRTHVPACGPPRDNPNLCKYVEGDIFEFRKQSARLFWFYDEGRVVVGAHAFKRQGQKAPRRFIEGAQRMRAQYLAAKKVSLLEIVDISGGEIR